MKIETGTPPIEGRYVVFVEGDRSNGYCEPLLVTWHGGKWHSWRKVLGWSGPVPVMRAEFLTEMHGLREPMEFDL